MLNTSLSWFNKSIENLKNYIALSIKQREDLIDLSNETNLIKSNIKLQKIIKDYDNIESLKKKIDYSAIVILLYGALEKYIEDVAKEYLNILSNLVSKYDNLPEKIKENYLQKSIDLLNNLKLDKYQNISPNDVINNLYYCQSSNLSYKINTDSYTQHTANFRYDTINQFFADLGIENINKKIIQNENFKTYLKLESIERVQYGIILSKIDQLVQIRNKISHGQLTDDIIDFIEPIW
ncbi:MAG TPA: hypothetical protein DCF68_23130, partial [Cyanothece sp. UBA12306]|nr:hypothetical protein [Cyanothece sp. UBA12306]